MGLRTKTFEIFNGLFDFGSGSIRNGFYPISIGGQSAPPVNIVRSETGDSITPKRALELSVVWACVWLIADTISTLPFCVKRRKKVGGFGVEDVDNPLYTVLGLRPNLQMSAITYWQFMKASELLWGNGYSLIDRNAGQVSILEPLLPQFVVPYRVKTGGSEFRYKYYPGGLTNEPIADYSSDQVFHTRDRTLDGLIGISRIEYGRQSMGIARATDKATAEVYRNGMRTNGFLMYDKTLKEGQRNNIRADLAKLKSGGEDSSGFMILEAGMNFTSLSMPPQDVQLIEARKFSVEDICRLYNVPPVLVGDQGVSTWGTGIEQLMEGFKALTIRPHLRKWEMDVRTQLVPTEDRSFVYLKIDTDDLVAMDPTARAAADSSDLQNGVKTRDEVRAKRDLPPYKGDGSDKLTVQSNLVTLDKLEEMGGQPTMSIPQAPPGKKPPPAAPPTPAPPAK